MTTALVEHDIAELVPPARRGSLRDCILLCAPEVLDRIKFSMPPDVRMREGYRIELTAPNFRGKLHVGLGSGTGHLRIETNGSANLDVRMFRQSSLFIGRGTTVNGARIVCDHADVVIGRDGLWSDEIIVQSNDQHGLVDMTTREVVNGGRRRIEIGDHVWIGRRTTIMPDVAMGRGSVLATGAVLTSDVPENTIYAGVPARQVRDNISWSRQPDGFSPTEESILELEEIAPQHSDAD